MPHPTTDTLAAAVAEPPLDRWETSQVPQERRAEAHAGAIPGSLAQTACCADIRSRCSPRPLASLSFDLDDLWSYLKTRGDQKWRSMPSYLPVLVPRVLASLRQHKLRATFFVVGCDAAMDRNRPWLQAIAEAGHEIGNHSYRHEPWLHRYTRRQVLADIEQAETAIEDATGVRPLGFRGPGFSLSTDVLEELVHRGYLYDATTFPTFLMPLARAYYFLSTRLTPQQREERQHLGGRLGEGLRPVRPYQWQLPAGRLVELPVTTMPLARLPVHLSYLVCLATLSQCLAVTYFRTALALCRASGVQPSLLLHPTDFLGCDDTAELDFFPGMTLNSRSKMRLVDAVLGWFARQWHVVTLGEHARHAARRGRLPLVTPRFAAG